MLTLPPSDDALLIREELARALSDEGFPIRPATLATMATRGGGPPYRVFGRTPIYQWRTSLAWAHSRLVTPRSRSAMANQPPATSSSQPDVAQADRKAVTSVPA